mmetsp:Transcript_147019/g.256684  ORF Transcript_147019/g.256684 Transcript_147019/m.256684 type:complete len:97 (-) Transcript_147019:144-434(-)
MSDKISDVRHSPRVFDFLGGFACMTRTAILPATTMVAGSRSATLEHSQTDRQWEYEMYSTIKAGAVQCSMLHPELMDSLKRHLDDQMHEGSRQDVS